MIRQQLARVAMSMVVAIMAVACAGSDSKSTTGPSTDLNGTWTGTWTYFSAGLSFIDSVTVAIAPYGNQTNANWTSSSGASGSFLFATGASLSGTFSIQQAGLGINCSGTGEFTGTASGAALALSVPTIASTNCSFSSNNQFTLHH